MPTGQQILDACFQVSGTEGFGDVVVGTILQSFELALNRSFCRKQDNRNVTGGHIRTQLFRHGDAVLAGHHDIADDDVGQQLQCLVQSLYAVFGLHHAIISRKDAAQEQAKFRIVLHQQHCLAGSRLVVFRLGCTVRSNSRFGWNCACNRCVTALCCGRCHAGRSIVLQEFGGCIIVLFPFAEVHPEAAALAQLAVHGNGCLVHLDEFPHQRQPDAGAAGMGKQFMVHQILETQEERLAPVLVDADALVLHSDGDGLLVLAHKDRNHLALGRVFKGIG